MAQSLASGTGLRFEGSAAFHYTIDHRGSAETPSPAKLFPWRPSMSLISNRESKCGSGWIRIKPRLVIIPVDVHH